jgi:hypothetical protein
MDKKFYLLLIVVLAVFCTGLVYFLNQHVLLEETFEGTITVNLSPLDQVSSPINISGQAKKFWFSGEFFYIKVFDSDGNLLVEAPAIAKGEGKEFVPFESVLEFGNPETSEGAVVFEPADSSLFSETKLEIPVIFFETTEDVSEE